MNDITDLMQRLKAAAEKATKGSWITFDDGFSDGEDAVVTNEARDNDCISPVAFIKGGGSESDDDSSYCAEQRANAEFIALANPANILALVAALESRTITVKLPKRHSMLLREDFKEDYHTEMAYKAEDIQEMLTTAGIQGVKRG